MPPPPPSHPGRSYLHRHARISARVRAGRPGRQAGGQPASQAIPAGQGRAGQVLYSYTCTLTHARTRARRVRDALDRERRRHPAGGATDDTCTCTQARRRWQAACAACAARRGAVAPAQHAGMRASGHAHTHARTVEEWVRHACPAGDISEAEHYVAERATCLSRARACMMSIFMRRTCCGDRLGAH